jgi:hypothetical protein
MAGELVRTWKGVHRSGRVGSRGSRSGRSRWHQGPMSCKIHWSLLGTKSVQGVISVISVGYNILQNKTSHSSRIATMDDVHAPEKQRRQRDGSSCSTTRNGGHSSYSSILKIDAEEMFFR